MTNERYGYIYRTTNIINGRKYIGQHKRIELDNYYKGSNKKLQEDIKRFGRDNFHVEILEWCYSKEQLDERERFWISFYSAETDVNYYNIYGGGYPDHIPQETRDIIRDKKLEINKQKGKLFWVNNGVTESLISQSQMQEFSINGYIKGRLPGTIYVNKDGVSIRIKETELHRYIKDGYSLGKDDNLKNNMHVCKCKYIWCYKDQQFETARYLTEYLKVHGYPKLALSTVTGITRGCHFDKYAELEKYIKRIPK